MLTYIRDLSITVHLVIGLLLLNMVDFITTKLMVDKLGFKTEVNPILLYTMEQTGTVYSILFIKLLFFLFLIPTLLINKKTQTLTRDSVIRILSVLCIIFVVVVSMNTYHLTLV